MVNRAMHKTKRFIFAAALACMLVACAPVNNPTPSDQTAIPPIATDIAAVATALPSPTPESTVPFSGMSLQEIHSEIEHAYDIIITWSGEEVNAETGPPWGESVDPQPFWLRQILKTLDEQLALYPQGFFQQMPETHIILSQCVRRADGSVVMGFADYESEYAAIFLTAGEYMLDAMDWYGEHDFVDTAGFGFRSLLHHEIGHAVFFMTMYEGVAYFDFDRYFAILPEDFVPTINVYDQAYKKYIPVNDIENVYFCSLYAMNNPMEFMAELFCLSMNPSLNWTFASPHIQAQLELFYGAVREAYDTTGWPEQTYWERALAYSG